MCYAGGCGKGLYPPGANPGCNCPWPKAHCPVGWSMVDTNSYEESASTGANGGDYATCVTAAVCENCKILISTQ